MEPLFAFCIDHQTCGRPHCIGEAGSKHTSIARKIWRRRAWLRQTTAMPAMHRRASVTFDVRMACGENLCAAIKTLIEPDKLQSLGSGTRMVIVADACDNKSSRETTETMAHHPLLAVRAMCAKCAPSPSRRRLASGDRRLGRTLLPCAKFRGRERLLRAASISSATQTPYCADSDLLSVDQSAAAVSSAFFTFHPRV